MIEYILAFIIVTLATARLTRNITFDDFPPTMWLRDRWDDKTNGTAWNELFHCPFCMGVWVALPLTVIAALTLGAFSSWEGAFFAFCAWMGVSYISGIIVASDWG